MRASGSEGDPYLEVIAILWLVWMTDAVDMTRHSVRIQCGPLLGIYGVGAFDVRSLALLHRLRKEGVDGWDARTVCVGGRWTDGDGRSYKSFPIRKLSPRLGFSVGRDIQKSVPHPSTRSLSTASGPGGWRIQPTSNLPHIRKSGQRIKRTSTEIPWNGTHRSSSQADCVVCLKRVIQNENRAERERGG